MPQKEIILFYKKLISVGGAELLLSEHYNYLKSQGYSAKLICFDYREMDRININEKDVILINKSNFLSRLFALFKKLKNLNPEYVFCHSGYIDFGIVALLSRINFSTFVHQPTSMSFNETDKLSYFFFNKYKNFAKKDEMFEKVCSIRRNMSFTKFFYINIRCIISQAILRRSDHIFVLSNYAVKEKFTIFNLKAIYLSGALKTNNLFSSNQPNPKSLRNIPNLVTVSRLDKNKRIDIIIKALKILRDNGNTFSFTICGTGPARKELEALVKNYKLEDSISFLGYIPEKDILNLYKEMDLFITVDWADYRITTYEVLLHNKKLIVSDDTDIDDWLLNSGYLMYSAPNKKDLAIQIKKSLESKVNCTNDDLTKYLSKFTWFYYFESIRDTLKHNA